jgi:hypothetical protein
MCKIGLISWPIDHNTPQNFYISIGEIYDKQVKNDPKVLSEFYRDLNYLYPFTYSLVSNKSYNSEDFKAFRSKYKLTIGLKLIGRIPTGVKQIIFRSPVLYDLTCMVPVFIRERKDRISYNPSRNSVFIVIPTLDPICRGKILDEVISNNPKYIIITGSVAGDNITSTTTLMSRYLHKMRIPSGIVIKSRGDKKPNCILQCLELIDIMGLNDLDISIACSCSDITLLQKSVRAWRRLKVITKRISYYCPYY